MRIVILGSAHPLRGGGIASFNERLAKALIEQGHEVDIYSFSLQYPSFLFPGKSQYTDEPAPQGIRIYSKVNSVNPLNWLKVGKELRHANYDVLIVRYWMPFFGLCLGTIQRLVRKNKRTKVVCIADNIVPHEKRIGDAYLTRYFLKYIDGCVTMSRSVLEDLNRISPSTKAVYSPHPLYDNYGVRLPKKEARKSLGIDEDQKTILFFGFIRHYKGLDILLEAMSRPEVRELGIKLLVVGEYYEDGSVYQSLIEELDLQDSLLLHTEFVPNDQVGQYFSASDLVVLPYRSATQSGITQVAYSFSVPMLVTNVGGLPELVEDDKVGFVVEANAAAIKEAIVRFYKEGKEEVFVRNIEVEKKKFSWEAFTEALLQTVKL